MRILDGNRLGAREHRIKELRPIASGPLPGPALVVYDPGLELVVDMVPCTDASVSERRLLLDILGTMDAGDVWIADRNFCTTVFLLQTAANGCHFIVRQHEQNVRWEPCGRRVGRSQRGTVDEQPVVVTDPRWGEKLAVRRITAELDEPTADGETVIHILTDLLRCVRATRIADAYHGRWRIDDAFRELATAPRCEISSLGYPQAALFAFGIGLIAQGILSLVRTVLALAHGEECLEEIAAYYVADEISGVMRGTMVAIGEKKWGHPFGQLTPRQTASLLVDLAQRVNLNHFRKYRRGPKKPRPPAQET